MIICLKSAETKCINLKIGPNQKEWAYWEPRTLLHLGFGATISKIQTDQFSAADYHVYAKIYLAFILRSAPLARLEGRRVCAERSELNSLWVKLCAAIHRPSRRGLHPLLRMKDGGKFRNQIIFSFCSLPTLAAPRNHKQSALLFSLDSSL